MPQTLRNSASLLLCIALASAGFVQADDSADTARHVVLRRGKELNVCKLC